jgi:hypothetical protein
MMTPDEFRWAEALALEKPHGEAAPRFVADRIGALALAGDTAGVERLRQISDRLEALIYRTSAPA